MEEQSIYRRAKPWQIRLYTLAPGGIGNCFYLLMMYVSYIANVGYGIVATVAGIIMTCTRIFDGVTDPLCAFISDRINTKHGKIRILLAIGWVIMALSCWLMFIGGIGGGIVYFIVVYCLYIVGYTITSLASNIATPVITNDPKQRPLLARWQNIWTMATMMVLNMVVAALFLHRRHDGRHRRLRGRTHRQLPPRHRGGVLLLRGQIHLLLLVHHCHPVCGPDRI